MTEEIDIIIARETKTTFFTKDALTKKIIEMCKEPDISELEARDSTLISIIKSRVSSNFGIKIEYGMEEEFERIAQKLIKQGKVKISKIIKA